MIIAAQILSGLASLVALGNATKANNTKFDRIVGWIFCVIFIVLIVVMQGVDKCWL